MIGRPFLSDSIPMLTDSFCPVVYQRQRITRDAQDLKPFACRARECLSHPTHIPFVYNAITDYVRKFPLITPTSLKWTSGACFIVHQKKHKNHMVVYHR